MGLEPDLSYPEISESIGCRTLASRLASSRFSSTFRASSLRASSCPKLILKVCAEMGLSPCQGQLCFFQPPSWHPLSPCRALPRSGSLRLAVHFANHRSHASDLGSGMLSPKHVESVTPNRPASSESKCTAPRLLPAVFRTRRKRGEAQRSGFFVASLMLAASCSSFFSCEGYSPTTQLEAMLMARMLRSLCSGPITDGIGDMSEMSCWRGQPASTSRRLGCKHQIPSHLNMS